MIGPLEPRFALSLRTRGDDRVNKMRKAVSRRNRANSCGKNTVLSGAVVGEL